MQWLDRPERQPDLEPPYPAARKGRSVTLKISRYPEVVIFFSSIALIAVYLQTGSPSMQGT